MKKSEKEVIVGGKVLPTATPIAYSEVEKLIVSVRGLPVIVDADVAKLYGVATKRVNEAVRNNPEKFPSDYMFELDRDESSALRSKISSLEHDRCGKGRYSKYNYKAFTEKGLYMLATVLPLIGEAGYVENAKLADLVCESKELSRIFSASVTTTKRKNRV